MNLVASTEQWPVAGRFTISRGSRTHADVITVRLETDEENGASGMGESTPYGRYGESPEQTLRELRAAAERLKQGAAIGALLEEMPAGATRNSLDAAWWDLRCKQSGKRITQLLQLPDLRPITTAYTLSLDTPERMEAAARAHAYRPLLKVKTGSDNVRACMEAVRRGAPESALIVDANEAWHESEVAGLLEVMVSLGVKLVEQPLPVGQDALLATIRRPLPVVADESVHTAADIPLLRDRYDGVNLKLDKTGGLTEALRARDAARENGMLLMCGCMLGTSLAMAPAMVLAQEADFVDLDAPLLLAKDRPHGIEYHGSLMHPFSAALWG